MRIHVSGSNFVGDNEQVVDTPKGFKITGARQVGRAVEVDTSTGDTIVIPLAAKAKFGRFLLLLKITGELEAVLTVYLKAITPPISWLPTFYVPIFKAVDPVVDAKLRDANAELTYGGLSWAGSL